MVKCVGQACVDVQSPLHVSYPLRDLTLLYVEKAWLLEGQQKCGL